MQYNENFTLIAKTFQGLEEVLAKELTVLGAENVEIGKRMVSFTADKRMMYQANFSLHTALRILKPIKQFEANTADEVYEHLPNRYKAELQECFIKMKREIWKSKGKNITRIN